MKTTERVTKLESTEEYERAFSEGQSHKQALLTAQKAKEDSCDHDWYLISSGGDAESGPITITQCTKCGKRNTQFGM